MNDELVTATGTFTQMTRQEALYELVMETKYLASRKWYQPQKHIVARIKNLAQYL